jgi:small subunit ribosomal protein S34
VRSRFERYPEKSYFRIQQVETLPNEENRKIKVMAEKVFRGRKYEKLVQIEGASYKTDYRLLSKKEEETYCQVLCSQTEKIKLIAPQMDFPPLLKEFLTKETGKNDIKMRVYLKKSHNKNHRLAQEGEKADVVIPIDIGNVVSPSLFEGLQVQK